MFLALDLAFRGYFFIKRHCSILDSVTVFPHKVSAETIIFGFENPKVTVHKCAETIQGRKLYEEIRYLKII